MRFFTRFREAEAKSGALLDMEWRLLGGGFIHLGKNNWTICHRLLMRGAAMFGTQEEFVVRAQCALDFEHRFSWLTVELFNMFEARPLFIWLKVWPGRNLKLSFCLGWRLTTESRKFLKNQVAEHERRSFSEARKHAAAVQKIEEGGIINATVSRSY